jgi:hypothetical protein
MESLISAAQGLLHNNQFFQGGILLGAITWGFYQIKAIPTYIFGKLRYWATYTIHFDEKTQFYPQFSEWFSQTYPKKFRNVEVLLVLEEEHDRSWSGRRDWKMKFRQYADTNFILFQRRILWVSKNREKLEAAQSPDHTYRNSYQISGLFAGKAIRTLCEGIFQRKVEEVKAMGLRVATRSTYDSWDIRTVQQVKSFDHLFFEDKQKVIDDLNKFVERRDLYVKKRINYKRCYLFYGPGGTGKSSMAAAIADHLGHDLYVINLANVKSDQALIHLATEIPKKSTVVMEDIDCVLKKRSVKGDIKLNFSTVLNFLDGPTSPTECVMVMTTNHPESLDDALIRKGRVDFLLKIDYPRPEDASEFMSMFYDQDIKIPGRNRLAIPMSEVQEICMQHPSEEAVKLVRTTKAASFAQTK